jgi:hypothetical protein
MGSPVSGRALGECNAITSPGFGPSGLTFVRTLETTFGAQSALQGLLLSRDCGRNGDWRWYRPRGRPRANRAIDAPISPTVRPGYDPLDLDGEPQDRFPVPHTPQNQSLPDLNLSPEWEINIGMDVGSSAARDS